MKVVITDSFVKSLEKLENASKFWKREFYVHWYHELKWRIWALRTFYKVISKEVRPYDYHGILVYLKKHISEISTYLETKGIETTENRDLKIKDMNRCTELINNILEENFLERCGYVFDPNKFSIEDDGEITTEEDEKQREIFKKARELEKKEWNELWDIIRNGKAYHFGLHSWWD